MEAAIRQHNRIDLVELPTMNEDFLAPVARWNRQAIAGEAPALLVAEAPIAEQRAELDAVMGAGE